MISICKYTAYKSKHDETEKIYTKIRTRGCGIKVQIEKSSNGLKLNKRLKEEIKEFSKRKDYKNYTKLLEYCSEKIKKFKLTNFQSKNIYLNLKSFLETIAENYQITNNKNEFFKWTNFITLCEAFSFNCMSEYFN